MFLWKNKTPVAKNAIYLDKETQAGRPFRSRFLEAGLVKYDFGVCLLKKDTINKFINSFIGKPVIIDHKDVINDRDIVGEILNVWFNADDGWYWCDGVLRDKKAIDLIENKGYNVSCQYAITDYSVNTEDKLHNGNPYDKEILDGDFEHLAIVNNPRYEGAYIAVNAYVAKNAICRNEFKESEHPRDKEGKFIELGEEIENYPQDLKVYKPSFTQEDFKNIVAPHQYDPVTGASLYIEQESFKDVGKNPTLGKNKQKFMKEVLAYNERAREAYKKAIELYKEDFKKAQSKSLKDAIVYHIRKNARWYKDTFENDEWAKSRFGTNALTASNDEWITVHPNGEEHKGRHLLIKDGETVEDAMHRNGWYKKRQAQDEQNNEKTIPSLKPQPVIQKGKKAQIQIRTTDGTKTVTGDRMTIDGIDVVVHPREKDWDMSPFSVTDFKTGLELARVHKGAESWGTNLKDLTFKTRIDKYNELIKQHPIINLEPVQEQKTNDLKSDTEERKAKVQANWKEKSQAELRDAIKTFEKKISRGAIQDDLLENSMQTVEWMRELLDKPMKNYNPLKDGKTLAQQADEFLKNNPGYDPHQEFIKRQKSYKPWKYAKNSIQTQYQKIIDYITNFKGATMTLEERLFKGLFSALKARNEAEEEQDKKEKDDKKAENDDTDKRKLIDEVAGIMKSAGADDEEIRTAIAKMEKIAYDKSEAGTADNKAKNEDDEDKKDDKVDKRDLIRQIAAIAGKEEDSEDVRTIIKLAEKIAYEKSEAGTADNCKGKNKAKNDEDEEEYKEFIEDVEKEASNKKATNALKEATNALYSALAPEKKMYISQKEGLELGKKIYG